ncbi:MAG: hypothetical protein IPP45_19355 [Sphingomonadales bacterium]|nr:hypothetical protein [Sphingomonadales bacterium]
MKIARIRSADKDFLPQAAPAVAQTADLDGSDREVAVSLPRGGVFSAAEGSVQPLSFSLSVDRDHAHSGGGARNRRIAPRDGAYYRAGEQRPASRKVMVRA